MKNKLFSFIGISLLLFSVSLTSCSKEVEATPQNEELKSGSDPNFGTISYFLDEEESNSVDVDLNNPELRFVIEGTPNKRDADKLNLKIHAFTTAQSLYDYGNTKGIQYELFDNITDHLAEYAEINGYIDSYEATGELDQDYIDYHDSYIETQLSDAGLKMNSHQKASFAILHKEYTSGPDMLTLPGIGLPIMWPGWNNDVSAFTPMFFGGVNLVFDRSFYRDRFNVAFTGWAGTRIIFGGPLLQLDDRAGSWWGIGI